MELLVGMGLFTIVSMAAFVVLSQTFRRTGTEGRAAISSLELKNVLQLFATELRLGTAVSPYLPGSNPNAVICATQLAVTPTTVRFLVMHDNAAAPNGREVNYVGYSYDPATRRLFRGSVPSTNQTGCTLPPNDPLNEANRFVLATNIVRIDGDGNGTIDPMFSLSNGVLNINMGISIGQVEGSPVTQSITSRIFVRSL